MYFHILCIVSFIVCIDLDIRLCFRNYHGFWTPVSLVLTVSSQVRLGNNIKIRGFVLHSRRSQNVSQEHNPLEALGAWGRRDLLFCVGHGAVQKQRFWSFVTFLTNLPFREMLKITDDWFYPDLLKCLKNLQYFSLQWLKYWNLDSS